MKEKYYIVAKSITRWKLDNWFENWLGYRADKSEFWKRLYVLYYRLYDSTYYKNGLTYVQKEIERQYPNLAQFQLAGGNVLSKRWLQMDMIYSLHRFGINFTEYFVHKYYSLNVFGREQINNLRLQYGFCELVNAPSIREIFDNKGLTYQKFKQFYKRDLVTVYAEADYVYFDLFVSKHSSFIYKPLKGVCGRGIKIYRDVKTPHKELFDDFLNNGSFVVEELIDQGEEMAVLHRESINTLRVATFKLNDDVIIYGAGIRMGTGSSIVDNAGSGGLFCHVNHMYGFIDTNAKDYTKEYVFHPDTGVRFIGFDIPKWDEAKELVTEMARTIKDATVISWDLAYSKKGGWCMVEANDVGGPNLIQGNGVYNKYILHNLIDRYFNACREN